MEPEDDEIADVCWRDYSKPPEDDFTDEEWEKEFANDPPISP